MSPAFPGSRTTCSPGAFERASMTRAQASLSAPPMPSTVTRKDAAPAAARAAGRSSGVKRSSAEGGSFRAKRTTAGPSRVSAGTPLLVAHGEGPRGVAPEQVLERGVGGGAGDEGVEGGAQLPLVEAPGLHVGRRGRGREHEPQAVVARLLRRGGQRDPVAVAGVVELEPLDHRPVEAHLDRRLLHPAVRGRVEDRRRAR